MNDINITISGAGTTFSYELHVIEKALKDAGLDVTVIDEYHIPLDENDISKFKEYIKEHKREVTITSKHLPWGG